jgi:hypothetical protein
MKLGNTNLKTSRGGKKTETNAVFFLSSGFTPVEPEGRLNKLGVSMCQNSTALFTKSSMLSMKAQYQKVGGMISSSSNPANRRFGVASVLIVILSAFLLVCVSLGGVAEAYTVEQLCNAIYKAEGGAKTKHPYGILAKYKTTTPRQACINTIKHAVRDWDGKTDFIVFLGSRYCPIGCENDNGTNQFWVSNVKYFLAREAKCQK